MGDDSKRVPERGKSKQSRGGAMRSGGYGGDTLLEEARAYTSRGTEAAPAAPVPMPQPAAIPELTALPEAAAEGPSWGARKRRSQALGKSLDKTTPRSVLFTAPNGETLVCDHDKRGTLRMNADGTVLVLRYGTDQVRVIGKRLHILRDAFEAHRVDDVRQADDPRFDSTPELEQIRNVIIGIAELFKFDERGEYTPLAE
jgi:hypothetical protein